MQQAAGRDGGSAKRSRAWRVAFGSTMMAAMGVATFIGFVIGVLAPFLIDEFDMSRSQLGALTTVLYLVGGFGSPLAGQLVDRLGGRIMLVILFLAGAAGTVGVAVAQSYAWLVAAMLLAGFSLASGNPVTNKLVAAHVSPGARGTIMGIKQAGVPLGKFLAGVLMPGAALLFGWRAAVLLAVVIPVAGLAAGAALLPRDAGQRTTRAERRRRPLGSAVRWLAVYAFLMGTGVAVMNVYLPLYVHDQLRLSVTTAGAVASVTGIVGVFSRVIWGKVTDRLADVTPALIAIAISSALASLLLVAAQYWAPWLAWLSAFVFGAATLGWIVVGMIGVVSVIGVRDAGRASGVVLLGFYTGFVSSPILFGALVDWTGRYDLAWALVGATFALAALVGVLWRRTSPVTETGENEGLVAPDLSVRP